MTTQVQNRHSGGGMLMTLAVLILIILVAVWYFNLPGHHSLGQRVGDAVDDAPHAVVRTTDKLTSPETSEKVSQAAGKVDSTLKKTGDAASSAVAEVGNDIKAAVNEQKKQNSDKKPDKSDSDDNTQ